MNRITMKITLDLIHYKSKPLYIQECMIIHQFLHYKVRKILLPIDLYASVKSPLPDDYPYSHGLGVLNIVLTDRDSSR